MEHQIVFRHVKRNSYKLDVSPDDPQMIEAGPILMSSQWIRCRSFSSVLLRFALGLSFLSAVADRFGWLVHTNNCTVEWNSSNGIRSGDDAGIGSRGTFECLRLFGSGRGLASNKLPSISVQRGPVSIAKIRGEEERADGIASFVMLTPMRG
jgi:hypothetical protein